MTGNEIGTLAEEVNGGASVGDTLLTSLLNIAKAFVEQRRPWMALRSTDTSKTVTAANTWQTAIDLSTITNLNRFYGDFPIRLTDGATRITYFRQVPFEERLAYKDTPNTFVYDEANKVLYLNGTVVYPGTLWINFIKDTPDVALTDTTAWSFPSWSHPLLAFMAIGIHKGGIDFDDINARMSPENRATAEQLVKMLENWDNEKQLSAVQATDPSGNDLSGHRDGAIDMNG